MDELNQTIWGMSRPMGILYNSSASLGGILIYSGAKGLTVLKFGIGVFLANILAFVVMSFGHVPPLFAIGGTVILLSFLGILWLWGKERMALKGASTAAADYKLVGYVFLFLSQYKFLRIRDN
jgi:hypothetical protein